MPVYLVVAITGKEAIGIGVETVAPDNFHRVKDDTWLVDYEGPLLELYDKLGIYDGSSGAGFVTTVTDYAGRADDSIWVWLMAHDTEPDADIVLAQWPIVEPY